jgi:hypothetical protein
VALQNEIPDLLAAEFPKTLGLAHKNILLKVCRQLTKKAYPA